MNHTSALRKPIEVSQPQPILRHSVRGPYEDGLFLVVYACDHTTQLTPVGEFSTKESAQREADRLNREQVAKEEAIQMDRKLRGFRACVDQERV